MRKALAVLAGVAVLAAANWTIYARERQLAEGALVLLELAPVDPRSLMQGDYMALRFKVENDALGRDRGRAPEDGRIVVRVDGRGVAAFVRRDGGEPLGAGEARLRYRVRDGRVKFATNAYFFQEGTAKIYERARYGEFRASPAGELLLMYLRDEKLERLGPR
ncbi:MAG TPA: GDYXXLXY domain-containing protein [Burkholderiales bacterium]|nr:GDYXXLXY domain-containing protein [Burkholderiales bacterium]